MSFGRDVHLYNAFETTEKAMSLAAMHKKMQSNYQYFFQSKKYIFNPFLVGVACHTFGFFVPVWSASPYDEEKNCIVESEFALFPTVISVLFFIYFFLYF